MKYFVMMVNSISNAFTTIDSGKEIKFSLNCENNVQILSKLSAGDKVLGIRSEPLGKIQYFFEILSVSHDSLVLKKNIDIENSDVVDQSLLEAISENLLEEITDSKFKVLYNKLIEAITREPIVIKSMENIILYGPPGTGKTFKMQTEYIEKYRNRFVTTFHQSFSYEEFVEGLKAYSTEDKKSVYYDVEHGIFYKACVRASELAGYTSLQEMISDNGAKLDGVELTTANTVLLCIDEINRANVSAVFGDLISLIEPSKRIGQKNQMIVKLPYSKNDFAVPSNLRIIGTMNTADRSIQLLDSALRRRFDFEELLPNYDKIENATARDVLKAINNRIRALIGKNYQIGHSYFIGKNSDEEIFDVLTKNVIPLLEEYFYEETEKIRIVLNDIDTNYFYIEDGDAKKSVPEEFYDDDNKIYKRKDDDNKSEENLDNTPISEIIKNIIGRKADE